LRKRQDKPAWSFAHLTPRAARLAHGQADIAHDHLDEATRIASHTGDRNGLQQHFGPTNIAVWRASVGTELQQAGKVYEQAQAANIHTAALGMVRIGGMAPRPGTSTGPGKQPA
jgi:hypothetical protein